MHAWASAIKDVYFLQYTETSRVRQMLYFSVGKWYLHSDSLLNDRSYNDNVKANISDLFSISKLWGKNTNIILPQSNRVTLSRQQYNNHKVSDDILRSLIAFVLAYMATIAISTLLLSLFGSTAIVALTASITAVSNVGPGLDPSIGPSANFAHFSDPSKWVLSIAMLMGRLEILTVVILFTGHFWRR